MTEFGGTSSPVPPSGREEIISNQVYTADGSALDVYSPARGTPPSGGWPVIITIQGGGFEWARRSDLEDKLSGLTEKGFVVVPIDYAYVTPGGPSTGPAAIDDIRMQSAGSEFMPGNSTSILTNLSCTATPPVGTWRLSWVCYPMDLLPPIYRIRPQFESSPAFQESQPESKLL